VDLPSIGFSGDWRYIYGLTIAILEYYVKGKLHVTWTSLETGVIPAGEEYRVWVAWLYGDEVCHRRYGSEVSEERFSCSWLVLEHSFEQTFLAPDAFDLSKTWPYIPYYILRAVQMRCQKPHLGALLGSTPRIVTGWVKSIGPLCQSHERSRLHHDLRLGIRFPSNLLFPAVFISMSNVGPDCAADSTSQTLARLQFYVKQMRSRGIRPS
jgi:hypothetical protein